MAEPTPASYSNHKFRILSTSNPPTRENQKEIQNYIEFMHLLPIEHRAEKARSHSKRKA